MIENKRFDVLYEEDENIRYWEIIDKKNNKRTSNEVELCNLLNNLNNKNEQLKKENKRLKEILKIKRKEIINRVLALQEITDKYTNEVLFKNNVNPNDAVKQVLKEILSSKVKEYE